MARIHARSAPAQNALPRPPSTTTRSAWSADSMRKVSVSSRMTPSLKALRTSGRLSQTSATCAEGRSTSSVVGVVTASLPARRDEPLLLRGGRGPLVDDAVVHRVHLAAGTAVVLAELQRALHGVARLHRVGGVGAARVVPAQAVGHDEDPRRLPREPLAIGVVPLVADRHRIHVLERAGG